MTVGKTLEDFIGAQAPTACERIERAVEFAASEEDLRLEFEKAVEVLRKELCSGPVITI